MLRNIHEGDDSAEGTKIFKMPAYFVRTFLFDPTETKFAVEAFYCTPKTRPDPSIFLVYDIEKR